MRDDNHYTEIGYRKINFSNTNSQRALLPFKPFGASATFVGSTHLQIKSCADGIVSPVTPKRPAFRKALNRRLANSVLRFEADSMALYKGNPPGWQFRTGNA
ncbi:MAG: hypothetical protein ACRERV_15230 [Methylococcales bacterium]